MLTCFSQRQRGFNHSTQSCSSCVLRGMILVNLVCSKTRQTLTDYLTFAGNSSHIKCVVEPSWLSTATTLTIWNVNPQSGPGCHMLNSLHCLLLFWEAQELRQPTRQGEQKTLDKSYQYKFNGWKSCLLKERNTVKKIHYILFHAFQSWALGSDDRRNPIPRIDINNWLIDFLISW